MSLWILRFPLLIVESGVKHHNPNPCFTIFQFNLRPVLTVWYYVLEQIEAMVN